MYKRPLFSSRSRVAFIEGVLGCVYVGGAGCGGAVRVRAPARPGARRPATLPHALPHTPPDARRCLALLVHIVLSQQYVLATAAPGQAGRAVAISTDRADTKHLSPLSYNCAVSVCRYKLCPRSACLWSCRRSVRESVSACSRCIPCLLNRARRCRSSRRVHVSSEPRRMRAPSLAASIDTAIPFGENIFLNT
ncbi:unnamed protein product [Danaus chrysippus]|uniref:(African queen) hypothetical protein n=1 Tax=Danaus chrysippus TaxID=151541 RepID=A0A8J2W7N3_9NEOP|nr:unnamed protein product [Danaus chrysippus]